MMNAQEQVTADVIDPEGDTIHVLESGEVVRSAKPGSTLPGRYDDLGAIARGGFGEVRRVRDTLLDRVVAMKVLHAKHASNEHIRQRFLNEVRVTAQLQHPGIVAVHDRGELADGRLWFTMKEIRGRTLHEVIDELHSNRVGDGFGSTKSGWTFRRLVDAFARLVQAVAYAHQCGIVHRDVKPENLMVGEFGEVLVMDWGLARNMTSPDDPSVGNHSNHQHPTLTQYGDILGTPAYMSPEQARGSSQLHGPASDVYALGAVLYCLLSGKNPYQGGSSREILEAVLAGPPKNIRDVSNWALPQELCLLCEKAMQRNIADRYPDAGVFWNELVAWLDGVRLRDQALEVLEQARRYEPEVARLRSAETSALKQARNLQNEIRPYDPIEKKLPAWLFEDEAKQLGQQAALAETKWLEAVHGALSIDRSLPEAHALLADHYRERLVEAELDHRDQDAARAEELLRIHDRGKHAAFLRGDGRLTLLTNPPGAEVFVDRFVLKERRLVPVSEGMLGKTPLLEVPLRRGSYLLRIRSPGRAEVKYPVVIERDGHWDGVAPGEAAPHSIYLPNENELGADDVYVPAGWSWTGGDPSIPESLPKRRIWIDSFVVRRFPVTTNEYLEFLNDLIACGDEKEALAVCPRAQLSLSEAGGGLAFDRDAEGRFGFPPDREGLRWRPDWPIVLVDWHAAVIFTQWLSARTNQPWRLLDELEREKATRGADGRLFSWGDHPDATFACVADSTPNEPSRQSVHNHPFDESPHGVRGLCGNTRDWCANVWTHEGPPIRDARLHIKGPDRTDPGFRVIKGGGWPDALMNARSPARFGGKPGIRRPVVGFRVAMKFARKAAST